MESSRIKSFIFLFVFLGLFILVATIFYPFLTVIVWSGLFYAFLNPLYIKLTVGKDALPRHQPIRTFWAGFLAVVGVLLIVIPIALLSISIVRQISEITRTIFDTLDKKPEILGIQENGPITNFLKIISDGGLDISTLNIGKEIRSFMLSHVDSLLGLSGKVFQLSIQIIVSLVFIVFSTFFLLLDGKHLAKIVIEAIPIEKHYTGIFLRKFRDMGKHLIKGFFIVGLFQSFMLFLICLIFQIKSPLVIAALALVASFIPMVGTALVWVPIGILIIGEGNVSGGILFMLLSLFFVSFLDNFIRPVILHERLKIHPLLIFFSILGGFQIFQVAGLVLGPLIIVIFFTALQLYEDSMNPDGIARNRRATDKIAGQ